MQTTLESTDYRRIEAEIASDASPVGIDAKKTHVLILAKLESIERRLDRLERTTPQPSALPAGLEQTLKAGLATTTDTIDDTIARLAARGVDVDARMKATLSLIEKLTDENILAALQRIVGRMDALEKLTQLAEQGPKALATLTDVLDDEIARAAENGIQVDAALRNGLAAVLYLGQRVSTNELEALGALLRSDVLHPSAVDIVGRLGCALVAAAESPAGSVGPIKAISKLGDDDARRSTAFLLEFARRFGATLSGRGPSCTTDNNGRSQS